MKRWLTVLTVLLLLLGGCAEERPPETAAPSTAATAAPVEPDSGLYNPNHLITQASGGTIAAYPLDQGGYSLIPMGEKQLLVRIDQDAQQAQLILLSGETGMKEAETLVSNVEIAEHIWAVDNKIACYDSVQNAIVMLEGRLREVERIPLPKEKITSLQLDPSLTVAYYTAEDRICAFDLQTGISRLVRRVADREPELFGPNTDGMLRCRYETDEKSIIYELLSSQDGRSYYSGTNEEQLYMVGDTWFLHHTDGPVQQLIYHSGTKIQEFRPAAQEPILHWTVLEDGSLLTVHEKEPGILLELYDLEKGHRVASTVLKNASVSGVTGDGKEVWFVAGDADDGSDVLCRWNPEKSAVQPTECFYPYYSEENPDVQGLAECAAIAQQLGDAYGITVSLEAPAALLESYHFQEEYQVPAIREALGVLEEVLAQFPENFYKRIFRVTENKSFHISLVRGVMAANGETVPDGNGLQAWVKGDSYIVLPVGEDTLSQCYHQLWHLAETYVMNRNSFLDTWETMNPEGFSYLERYPVDPEKVVESYMSGPQMAFINAYSMTYPREDRATFFEYAIQPGNKALFESETMQLKLNTLCWSIRRAFKWEESKEIFAWEQYLNQPPYGNQL